MKNNSLTNLSNEELIEMFQNEKKDRGEILGVLYFKNSGLIKQIASKFSGYENIEDLMQESFFGLQAAAELYDPEKGAFSTYATIWLRQTIRRYIDNCGSCVRFPSGKIGEVFKYTRIANSYEMEFGREPTDKELAALLGVSIEEAQRIKADKAMIRIKSLDAPIQSEDETTLTVGDSIAGGEDPEAEVIEIQDNERLKLILWNEVAGLPEKEAEVITKRFKDNMSTEETGTALGMNKSTVSTIQARALKKLRQSEVVNIFWNDYRYSKAYLGVGVGVFQRTWTSSTEREAIRKHEQKLRRLYKKDSEKYLQYMEKEIEKTDKLLAECAEFITYP